MFWQGSYFLTLKMDLLGCIPVRDRPWRFELSPYAWWQFYKTFFFVTYTAEKQG
jgi:hypothetical protein